MLKASVATMITGKTFAGILLTGIGIVFFTNNKSISKGAYGFYKKLYTQKNLEFMFKATGFLLIVAGPFIAFFA